MFVFKVLIKTGAKQEESTNIMHQRQTSEWKYTVGVGTGKKRELNDIIQGNLHAAMFIRSLL